MVVADQFLMGSTNVEMENEKDSAKEEAVVKETVRMAENQTSKSGQYAVFYIPLFFN